MEGKIPQITIGYFEEVYIEHILDTLRITREELEEKLDSDSIYSLNKKGENFIRTYLKNQVSQLNYDNWCTAKELFVQWKLFEGVELEEESRDKKETLIEVLELFKKEIIEKEKQKLEENRKTGKIMVF